jgi:L-ascorbate metabolism protein UlaG (beta-lactamase superfamily)
VLLELGGVRLLTDPVLRDRFLHLRRHGSSPSPEVTPGLAGVLISHLHHDHVDVPSLRRLSREVPVVGPRGSAGFLKRVGFQRTIELAAGDTTELDGVEIAAVRAKHSGFRVPFGPTAEAIGFDIRAARRTYFAGDTDLFPEMSELAGHLDLALLPVWGWGPRLGPGHLDPERAAQAAALLRPRVCVPIHWGTFYPRGLERRRPRPLRDPAHWFAARVAELAPEVDVRVLERPGAGAPGTERPPSSDGSPS